MQFVASVVLIANSSVISVLITLLAGRSFQTTVVLQALAMYFAAIVLEAAEHRLEEP